MSIRQEILAGLFGGSIWRVKWAHLFKDLRARKHAVEQNEIERNEMYYGESVDWDIIMWSVIYSVICFIAGSPEPANCGLSTVVMWICESNCE